MLAVSLLIVNPASAQQVTSPAAETQAGPPAVVITVSPNQTAPSLDYVQHELADAEARSRRVRNALIGTSVAFGVGLILTGIGASQCQIVYRFNQPDDVLCNTAGNVLVPLGGTLLAGGVIGMITSGIMLGVRNKQKREIERDMRKRYYGSRLQWDIPSGRLVF